MDQWDNVEWSFNRSGRAYTLDERREQRLRRGQCPKCCVQTHKITVMTIRKPITNEDVWQGICIKCKPQSVPGEVRAAWDARHASNLATPANTTRTTPRASESPATETATISPNEGRTMETRRVAGPSVASFPDLIPRNLQSTHQHRSGGLTTLSQSSPLFASPPPLLGDASLQPPAYSLSTLRNAQSFSEWMKTVLDCKGDVDRIVPALAQFSTLSPSELVDLMDEDARTLSFQRFLIKLRPSIVSFSTNRVVWVALSKAMWTLLVAGSAAVSRNLSEQGYHVLILDRLAQSQAIEEVLHLLLVLAVFAMYEPVSFLHASGIETVLSCLSRFQGTLGVGELVSRCTHALVANSRQISLNKRLAMMNRGIETFFDFLDASLLCASHAICKEPTWAVRTLLAIFLAGDEGRRALMLELWERSAVALKQISNLSLNDSFTLHAKRVVLDALLERNSSIMREFPELLALLKLDPNQKKTGWIEVGLCLNVIVSSLSTAIDEASLAVRKAAMSTAETVIFEPLLWNDPHVMSTCMWILSMVAESEGFDHSLTSRLSRRMSESMTPCLHDTDEVALLWFYFYLLLDATCCDHYPGQSENAILLPTWMSSSLSAWNVPLREVEARALATLYSKYPLSVLEEHSSVVVLRLVDTTGEYDAEKLRHKINLLMYIFARNPTLCVSLKHDDVLRAHTALLKLAFDQNLLAEGLDLALIAFSKHTLECAPQGLLEGVVEAAGTTIDLQLSLRAIMTLQVLCASSTAISSLSTLESFFRSTLTSHVPSDEIRLASCLVLWTLASRHEIDDGAVVGRLFGCLLHVLRSYLHPYLNGSQPITYNVLVIRAALGAFAKITKCLKHQISRDDADTVVSMIYFVMGSDRDDTKSLELVLLSAIHLLSLSNDPLIECGVIVAIVDAMDEFRGVEPIQEKGSAALSQISSSRSLQVVLSILQTDGIDVLADALSSFRGNVDIQREVCRAFSHLSIDHESRMLMASQGAVDLLATAMLSFPDCPRIQEYGAKTLRAILSDCGSCVFDSVVLNVALRALARYTDSPSLQELMLDVIHTATSVSSACRDAFIQANGVEAILNTVELHTCDSSILERAFQTLGGFDSASQITVENNGIRVIMNGMIACIEDENVQRYGSTCLLRVALADSYSSLIRSSEAIGLCALILRAHYESEPTLFAALSALAAIVSNEHILKKEELDVVLSTMTHFRWSMDIQEQGCRILKSVLPSPYNVEIMAECRERLEATLNRASLAFPDKCVANSTLVLSSIE